ncbi:MAG: tripartite tricarboxylate transporter substrate binding protein [Betaproteobacteria bacterium]|nr:MAG: tripartite tricarboxylate transporter substrate binding protein [Betaproteobacteria bacterium]
MPLVRIARTTIVAVISTTIIATTGAHAAQPAKGTYPERPIRLIIAQAPGGNADIIARALAEAMGERLGQTIVADNRPGASGIIATELAVKAPPDGHTLLLVPSSFGVNPAARRNLPYDQLRDLAPITLVAMAPNVLVVGPALPIKSVADLVNAAKANPGKLTYGSSGNLGSPHLAGELFELMTQTDMVHVPYKGAAAAMIDLVAGRISLSFASLPSAIAHIRSGRLQALAVTTEKRFPLMPDLPTVSESGLPGFETSAWQGLVAPARTPPAIIKRLNSEAVSVIKQPAMHERMVQNGAAPVGSTPEELWDFARKQIEKWGKVIKAAGITPN